MNSTSPNLLDESPAVLPEIVARPPQKSYPTYILVSIDIVILLLGAKGEKNLEFWKSSLFERICPRHQILPLQIRGDQPAELPWYFSQLHADPVWHAIDLWIWYRQKKCNRKKNMGTIWGRKITHIKIYKYIYIYIYISGQIIIFHQPRFPWNKEISFTKPPFGVRSREVAIIWPDIMGN